MKQCFFIGHRDTPSSVLPALEGVIEKHILDYGVSEFIVGNYGNFDHLVIHALKNAKKQHPEIQLSLLIPYHPGERPMDAPEGFDGTYYPFTTEKIPHRYAIVRANQKVVQMSDYLICYVWHPGSNARDLVEYAAKHGVHITNLA